MNPAIVKSRKTVDVSVPIAATARSSSRINTDSDTPETQQPCPQPLHALGWQYNARENSFFGRSLKTLTISHRHSRSHRGGFQRVSGLNCIVIKHLHRLKGKV